MGAFIIDTALIPDNYDVQHMIDTYKNIKIMPIVSTVSNTTCTISDIHASSNSTILLSDILVEANIHIANLQDKLQHQELRILIIERRLSREEAKNLEEMLHSNDEASISLAKDIIKKFEDHEYSI